MQQEASPAGDPGDAPAEHGAKTFVFAPNLRHIPLIKNLAAPKLPNSIYGNGK
jgi:hypothetical protein